MLVPSYSRAHVMSAYFFKGSDRQSMVVEVRMQYCREIFWIPLSLMRRFYGAYLFSKSANSIFKILKDFLFRKNDFENRFFKNYII